jgi:hypothetical protein
MKLLPLLLTFLSLGSVFGISQVSTLTAKIIDQKTKKPITGVIVLSLSNQRNATYTNEEGIFSISVANNDSLKISCIGYKDSVIKHFEKLSLSTIELRPNFILLNEVVVNNSLKRSSSTLGNIGKEYKTFNQGGSKGSILLIFIPNQDSRKNRVITKLKYELSAINRENEKVNKGVVRVRLYSSIDTAIYPKSDLLQENIIQTIPLKNKQTLIVDISKYKIVFPASGVFVGLEWLGEKNNSYEINLNPAFVAAKSKVDPFSFISFYGKPFVHVGKMLDSYYTQMFGIEVEEN